MSLYAALAGTGPTGFGFASTAEEVVSGLDLDGVRVLITGANSGIGFESARALSARGATIGVIARTQEKAEETAARLPAGRAAAFACELASPASVLACLATLRADPRSWDALVLNAGIMALPKLSVRHGFEQQFLTNHLGHFLLATRLLDRLSPQGRVVALSSRAHTFTVRGGINFDNLDGAQGYFPWTFYGQSKLANLLFARSLARRFARTGRRAYAVHPGVIHTNLGRHMGVMGNVFFALANPVGLKSVPQGAATTCWAAVHPDANAHNGAYLADVNVQEPSRFAQDEALAERLWTLSEEVVSGWERGVT